MLKSFWNIKWGVDTNYTPIFVYNFAQYIEIVAWHEEHFLISHLNKKQVYFQFPFSKGGKLDS